MTTRDIFLASLMAGGLVGSAVLWLSENAAKPDLPVNRQSGQVMPASNAGHDAQPHDVAMRVIIARPLFDPNRHGAQPAANSDPKALPRLSGTLITPSRRLAIFSPADADKPIAVPEGGAIGAYVVEHVEAGHVEISGPDGRRSIQTAFSSTSTAQSQEAPK